MSKLFEIKGVTTHEATVRAESKQEALTLFATMEWRGETYMKSELDIKEIKEDEQVPQDPINL